MNALKKYTPFFASAVLMWVVLYVVYPHYQYYIDPDGTAYLTISRRYANGDYARAVNGYWSPWSCWLTALLIKVGLQPIPASVVINSLGATGFLHISQSFFLRFSLQKAMQWLLNITLAFFLVYAVFWQSFDDLWECFFLLSTLRIMLAERFLDRPALWIVSGLVGTLAYFAKAYSFPFFILNTISCTYMLARINKGRWLKPAVISIATMVVCSLPWIWALHGKYGIWTTSTAGTLNTSWYLVGHPIWKDSIQTLLPPPYPDSPYYWEDPWFVNGRTPHFWDSWKLFGMQILRVGYNLYKLLRSSVELSIAFPLICIGVFLLFARKHFSQRFSADVKVLALSMLLFPLGYVLINYEARYLWYMVPLSMVIAGKYLERQRYTALLGGVMAVSFVAYPIYGLIQLNHVGYSDYNEALFFKENMSGSFTSNARPGKESQSIERLAYFSGLTYYSNNSKATDERQILADMRRYKVKYYVRVCRPGDALSAPFVDENGLPFRKIAAGKGGCTQVYLVNP